MWKKRLMKLNLSESYISITLGFLVVIVGGILMYNYLTKNKSGQSSTPTTKQEQKTWQEVTPSLPTTHTVTGNENLWTIAEKYYNSGYNWVTLFKENQLINPDLVYVGQVLTVPKADTILPAGEKTSSAATEPAKTYTVVKGDNLWNIAVAKYGDGFAWTKISGANNLVNPNLIHTGNVLKIP